MAAPKGNEFWKLRSKHGRDKLFASSELLWEAACEYFKWCENNPWEKTETVLKGDRIEVKKIPTERPFTITGLCLYLGCNKGYFNDFEDLLKEDDNDFSVIITRIREIIYTQKFEGAAVGVFNPSIIARDLGLTDKQSHEHSITPISNDARKKILDNLKNDR